MKYYKDQYRKVSRPEQIPNPSAPILKWYMELYGCDIVAAYNLRMEEIWEICESERERLKRREFEEEFRESQIALIENILNACSNNLTNISHSERQIILQTIMQDYMKNIEQSLEATRHYISEHLSPPNKVP